VGQLSGRRRLDAFLDAHPEVDHVAVLLWAIALSEGEIPDDAVVRTGAGPMLRFMMIVPGTDVRVTWRVLSTGTPRLLWLDRLSAG
jgi:hypothetical protein